MTTRTHSIVGWCGAAMLAGLLAGPAPGALVLVEDGVSRAPIVVFENAPPLTRAVADELAEYIEKTSGARPEVIEGRPDPMPEHAIWVGFQPAIEALFPELDFAFEHPEEILIAANDRHLVIAGRDRWNPEHLTIPIRWGRTMEGRQFEYGTVNAVYTFLHDTLGVRWLWPGELGEDVLARDTIAVEPFVYRYHPQLRYRNEVFYFSSLSRGNVQSGGLWARRQRLQLDSLYIPAGGHGTGGGTWWNRFHEIQPELFALQPDGTRSGWPGHSQKVCKSNPAVWDVWLAEVEAQLQEDPNRTVFNAAASDAAAAGRCICEDCRAWDRLDGTPRRLSWQGLSQDYVAMSDREVTFANQLARMLRERFPDKDYYVMIHSYGPSRPAPVDAVPDDNVIISNVANCFQNPDAVDAASLQGARIRDQIAAWAKIAPKWFWRPNVGGWNGLPDISLSQAADDYRFIAERGAIGSFSALPEHWSTRGPLYYLVAQLAWNPYVDAQAVMDDYVRRAYGPAAGDMAAYWALMEEIREAYLAGNQERINPSSYAMVDAAFFERAYGLLDGAAAALGEDDRPVYARRVDFARAGLDYTRLIVDAHAQMQVMRASEGAEREAVADRVRANWEAIEQIHKEYPYALVWNWIRPDGGRMGGLHPDH